MTVDAAAIAQRLDVRADLRLVVDGISAQISGDGDALQVRTDDAAALTLAVLQARRAVPGGSNATLGAVTRSLHDAGISVTLIGEHGTVATIGHGQHPPLGALLPGVHVRPGRIRAAAPVAWRALHSSTAWPRVQIGALISISAIAVAVAARRFRAG